MAYCSKVASPCVSVMSRTWSRSRAASRAPRMRSPANRVVATMSETNAMVAVLRVRRLRAARLGR